MGAFVARDPRPHNLRGGHKSQQRFAAPHAVSLIVADLVGLLEGVRRFAQIPKTLGERLDWKFRQLLTVTPWNPQAQADVKVSARQSVCQAHTDSDVTFGGGGC